MGAAAGEQEPRVAALNTEMYRVLQLGDGIRVALGTELSGQTALHIALRHTLPAGAHKNVLLAGLVEPDVLVVSLGPAGSSTGPARPVTCPAIAWYGKDGKGNGDSCDDRSGYCDR